MVNERRDEDLVEAARDGDRRALEQLLQRHQERVFRFGMKMCGHPQDAEDVLQETLLAAARSIGDFRGAAKLSTWLFTIARRACLKKRRTSQHAVRDDEEDVQQLAVRAPSQEDAAFGKELRAALDKAFDQLEPEQLEVLLLRDVEGLKASEVSKILGISVAAVKSRLHRGRVRIRDLVAPMLGIEPSTAPTEACPDVLVAFSKNLEGEVSASVCAAMQRHLAECEHCRVTCDSLKDVLSACGELPAQPVPAPLQDAIHDALGRLATKEAEETGG